MNKIKEKLKSAVKTTAMSAQQIYKHKSFNLSKTQEDPEWDEPCGQFLKIHTEVIDLIEEVEKFQKTMADMCGSMVKIGTIFQRETQESDPDSVKRIASAYDSIMKNCSENSLLDANTRITEEVLALLHQKLQDMEPLLAAIDERKKAKMDYDHYYFKLEQLRSKQKSDPNQVIRNQNKFQECQTTLTAITDRLIDKFIEYESARPTFLAYEFQTLRSVQKDFFTSLSQQMSKFKSTQPKEGMPTDYIVAPYSSAAVYDDLARRENGSRRGPRARRSDDEEVDVGISRGEPKPMRTQSSFRRPTPGAEAENAFARKSSSKGLGGRGASIPVPVDVEEEPKKKPSKGGVYARVMYDYDGNDDDELTIHVGEKVRVTRQHESGWWTGEVNGKVGMFPATYVELI